MSPEIIVILWALSIMAGVGGMVAISLRLESVADQIKLLREHLEAQQRFGESKDDYHRRISNFKLTGRHDP